MEVIVAAGGAGAVGKRGNQLGKPKKLSSGIMDFVGAVRVKQKTIAGYERTFLMAIDKRRVDAEGKVGNRTELFDPPIMSTHEDRRMAGADELHVSGGEIQDEILHRDKRGPANAAGAEQLVQQLEHAGGSRGVAHTGPKFAHQACHLHCGGNALSRHVT